MDFSVVMGPKIGELCYDADSKPPVSRDLVGCSCIEKSGANTHIGHASSNWGNNHGYLLGPMLAIPIKDYEDVGAVVSGVSEAGPHRRPVPPVYVVSYDLSPCQRCGVRCIVGRAVVDDDDLTGELSRLQDDRADSRSFIIRGNCGNNSRLY